MKNREHLSLFGVGPIYGGVVIALTALGILLTRMGIVPAIHYGVFSGITAFLGVALILAGVWLWYCAVFRAKVDDHIKNNTEDCLPYIPKKAFVKKWMATIIGYPILAAILSGICLLF